MTKGQILIIGVQCVPMLELRGRRVSLGRKRHQEGKRARHVTNVVTKRVRVAKCADNTETGGERLERGKSEAEQST